MSEELVLTPPPSEEPKEEEEKAKPDKPRGRGYIWVTWLTKILAGEEKCLYRGWYKINHKYEKVVEDQDRSDFFATYNARHEGIVKRRAAELRASGWTVITDDEKDEKNAGRTTEVKIRGDRADLAGKPDIVAMKPAEKVAKVIDAKSGKRRESDHWQVLIYLFALPLTWLKDFAISGEVEYHDGRAPVRAFGAQEREKLTAVMKILTGPDAPAAKPGASECRYCDIAQCQFRYKAPEGSSGGVF